MAKHRESFPTLLKSKEPQRKAGNIYFPTPPSRLPTREYRCFRSLFPWVPIQILTESWLHLAHHHQRKSGKSLVPEEMRPWKSGNWEIGVQKSHKRQPNWQRGCSVAWGPQKKHGIPPKHGRRRGERSWVPLGMMVDISFSGARGEKTKGQNRQKSYLTFYQAPRWFP